MSAVAPDTSEFQVAGDMTMPRRVWIFRATFGAHYLDPKFLANADTAARLYAAGKLDGVILYTVYLGSATPAEQYAWFWKAVGPHVPPWLMGVMLDCERWAGTSYELSGDHSTQLNTLYGLHAHRMGSWASVLGYGNRGDLAAIWPGRDARCRVIEAKYGRDVSLDVKGAIGVQYTDGQTKWGIPSGLPWITQPFGPCDHNVFPAYETGAALRAALRPAPVTPPPPTPAPPPRPSPGPTPTPAAPSHLTNGVWSLVLFDTGRVSLRRSGSHVRDL